MKITRHPKVDLGIFAKRDVMWLVHEVPVDPTEGSECCIIISWHMDPTYSQACKRRAEFVLAPSALCLVFNDSKIAGKLLIL